MTNEIFLYRKVYHDGQKERNSFCSPETRWFDAFQVCEPRILIRMRLSLADFPLVIPPRQKFFPPAVML